MHVAFANIFVLLHSPGGLWCFLLHNGLCRGFWMFCMDGLYKQLDMKNTQIQALMTQVDALHSEINSLQRARDSEKGTPLEQQVAKVQLDQSSPMAEGSAPPPPMSAAATFTAQHCGPFSLPVYQHSSKRPLHLVFLTNPVPFSNGGQISETLWVRDVVLHKLQRPVVIHYPPEDQKHDFHLSDSLIVTLFLKRMLWVERARTKGLTNLGIYHMGDEKYDHPTDFIPHFDYVIRNYYNAVLEKQFPNVHWVPQGSKSGLGNHQAFIPSTFALTSQRPHVCNFLGSLRSNRASVLNMLEQRGIRCFTNVNKWEGKGAKDPILYRFVLENSQFTLCPWGNNPETMRLYEALECGSIPLLQRWKDPEQDPLTGLGSDNPIPVFDAWTELPDFLEQHKDPTKVDELQAKVIRWWVRRKDALMTMARNVIEESFVKKYGEGERTPVLQPCTM
eukprot:GGOE01044502.1.p1 GENE.GGOE01044502.1~~GGOE01044502.1.p1  ORF type:complete len:447 (+),score=110.76 GGOE01044502.1:54-1394(+)